MKRLESPAAVIVGCVLVVAVNTILLATAAWYRSGRPDSELRRTERELAMPEGRMDEGGDLLLTLHRVQEPPGPVERVARSRRSDLPLVDLPWVDRDKLAELGFDVRVDPDAPEARDAYAQVAPRRAFLVLEYEGPAWTSWMARREREVRQLRERFERGAAQREGDDRPGRGESPSERSAALSPVARQLHSRLDDSA